MQTILCSFHIMVFRVMTPCSLADGYDSFVAIYYYHLDGRSESSGKVADDWYLREETANRGHMWRIR